MSKLTPEEFLKLNPDSQSAKIAGPMPHVTDPASQFKKDAAATAAVVDNGKLTKEQFSQLNSVAVGPQPHFADPATQFKQDAEITFKDTPKQVNLTDDLKAVGMSVLNAANKAASSFWGFVDWLLPFDEMMFGGEHDDSFMGSLKNSEDFDKITQGYVEKASDVTQKYVVPVAEGVGGVIPQAALAYMTAGTSLAGSAAGSAASTLSNTAPKVATAVTTAMKSPQFWFNFGTEFGGAYQEAKNSGASDTVASAAALLQGYAGAQIEMLGGIDVVPTTKTGIVKWITTAGLQEGGEGFAQNITNGIIQKAMYDHDKEWFSLTDSDAILNPSQAVQNFLLESTVGTIASAGQLSFQRVSWKIQRDAFAVRTGSEYLKHENGHSMDEAIAIGLSNAKSTDAYRAAEAIKAKYDKKDPHISAYEVGRMVIESSTPQAARARQIEALALQSAQENGLDPESATVQDVAFVASRFGRPVRFVDYRDIQGTGEYDPATGVISLNAGVAALTDETRRQELINEVIKHELAHSVERTKLGQQLEQIVRSSMGAGFDTAVQAKLAEYQNYGKALDETGAKHEVVAQWLGKNLYQNGFAQAVINGDAKVGNVILRTLDQVRLALGGTQKSRTAANIAIVERLFMRALQQSPALANSGTDIQYSLGYTTDDQPVVVIQDNILDGVPSNQWIDKVKEIISQNFSNGIPVGGRLVRVNKMTRDEYTHSKNTQYYQAKDGTIYEDKLKAAGYLDEIVLASTNYINEDLKHARKDNFIQFARGDVLMRIGTNDYSAKVIVGFTTGNNMVLYDVIDFVPTKFTVSKIKETGMRSPSTHSTVQDSSNIPVSDPTVPQNGGGVNTYDMQNGAKNSQSSFEGSDEIAEAVALMERERAERNTAPVEENDTLPLSRQSPTAPLTRGAEGEMQQSDAGTVSATNIPSPLESGRVSEGTVSQAQTVEELTAEIGDEAVYRRMYYAAQIDRPPATLKINGQTVNTTAYMDELYVALPDDDLQLTAYLKEREAEKAAQIKERYERGETEAEWTETDLQILTARSKLEWSELGDSGESGSKTRRFYEQRLKGKDANKAHEEELLELLAGRSETYSPISNQKTFNEMQEKLRTDADYKARLQKRILRYKPNDLFNAKDAAAAQIMINDARNEGDLNLYTDLVQGLSRKGTELGRAVQVLSMQALLTPEGSLKAAQRTLRSQADKVMYDGANEDLDIFAERITDAIERAAEHKKAAVESDTQQRGIKHPEYSDDTLRRNAEQIAQMKSVHDVPAERLENTNATKEELYRSFFERLGNSIYSEEFGEISLSNASVRSEIRHGSTAAKIASIEAIPSVINNGKVIWFAEKEAGVKRVLICAPITIGNKPYYMGVMLQRDAQHQRLYLHDVVIEEEAATLSQVDLITTGTHESNDNLYATSILRNALAVKRNNTNLKGAQQFTDAQGPSANAQDAAVDTPTNTITQSESVVNVEVPLTRDELTEALAQDIAGDNSPYITADEIRGILERAVESASDIPDQLKRYLKKELGSDMGTLAQRIAKMHEAGHLNDMTMRRVMEETLGLPTLTSADVDTLTGLVNELNDAPDQSAEQLEAMESIYRFLGEKLPVTALDTLQAWRKFGMLFNLKTHIRNFGSNAVFSGVNKLDSMTAAVIEHMFKLSAEERTAALGWSLTEHGRQVRPVVDKSAEQALLRMRGLGQKYELGTNVLNRYRKAFGDSKVGEVLNTLNDWNSEMLEKGDTPWFKRAYTDALGQIMVARGLTEVNAEVENIAFERALDAVFRGENTVTELFASMKRYQNSTKTGQRLFGHAVDIAVPFSKTPANIAYQAVEHSPVGLAHAAYDLMQYSKGKSGKTKAQIINEFSKGITGSMLLGIGALLGSAGLFVTGFGKTEKERAADELAGIQENAFRFGNVTISLDWLQPAASPLIVGASMAQRLKEDGLSFGSIFGAVFDGTDSLFEMTMLQSLYDILGGYDAGASASMLSVAENLMSQSVPTLFGQAARAIDPTQRKTSGESALSSVIGDGTFAQILQKVMARIPGLTYLLEPELDVWGNTVYRTGKASTGSGILNALQQFILPANIKIATGDDEISQIVMELYNSDEKQPGRALPSAITREKAAELGVSYEDANRMLGQNQYAALLELLQDRQKYTVTQETTRGGKTVKQKRQKYWSDMTDEERLQVLKRVYQAEKDAITDPDGEYYDEIVRRMS